LLLPSLALLPLSNQAASVSTPSSQFNADQLLTQEIPSILQTPNLEAQSPRMHGVLSTLAMHGSVAQLDRLLVSLISSLNQSTNTLVLSWLNTALHLYCASVRRTSASLDAKPLLRALELISTIKPLETVTCTTYEPVLVALGTKSFEHFFFFFVFFFFLLNFLNLICRLQRNWVRLVRAGPPCNDCSGIAPR
jgi:hypothetical protein